MNKKFEEFKRCEMLLQQNMNKKTKRNNVKNKSVKQIQFIQLRFIVITHNRKIAI